VAKRRYQEGLLKKEKGHFYSFFYRDRQMPDGSTRSVFTRIHLGQVGEISDLSARREHDRLRQLIHRERGSVPTAPRGETFEEVAKTYMKDIGPQLSIATVRQRHSHLNAHLLPRFGSMALMAIDIPTLQRFVTGLSGSGSKKSALNLIGTLNAILAYAKKCGIRVPNIPVGSLTISGDRDGAEAVYFKRSDVQRILAAAREPYRTMFVLASVTGLRAGELLGLTVADIDFDRLMVCPRKQADDRTRVLRELKTKRSRTPVPITPETAAVLRDYLKDQWRENPQGLLFPNRKRRPCKRANVVKFGLHPVLRKLGLPIHKAGLHAFRHGLGTALADAGASPAVVQRTLRHTDIKTTLRFYVHADIDAQRSALAKLQSLQSSDYYK
jgi:integrase